MGISLPACESAKARAGGASTAGQGHCRGVFCCLRLPFSLLLPLSRSFSFFPPLFLSSFPLWTPRPSVLKTGRPDTTLLEDRVT